MQRRIRVQPRFWTFIIVLMILCFGVSYGVAQLRYSQVSGRLSRLEEQRNALANEVQTLNNRLAYVRSDEYVERVARDELNMLLPGEIRYVSN